MTIVQDYLDYTKQYKEKYGEKTLVLIQVGSFYEVYALKDNDGNITGSDIEIFSRINDLLIATKTNMKCNKKTVLMAGFGLLYLDKYIKRLQNAGYTIIVINQDMQAKNTTRSISQIISPGTFFSFDSTCASNVTMCIWLHKTPLHQLGGGTISYGVSTLDVCTGHTSIGQYELDNSINIHACDDLERLVSLYKPSEYVFIYNVEMQEILKIIQQCGLANSKQHLVSVNEDTYMSKKCKNAMKQTYISEIIQGLYSNNTADVILETGLREYEMGMQCFVYLIDFIHQHSPHFTTRLYKPKYESHPDNMILANHSLRQLNILDDERHEGHLRSVSALLNKCITSMGRRAFYKNLANPITNTSRLQESYDLTEYLLKNKHWENIYQHFKGIRDIEKFQRKLILERIAPKEFSFLVKDLQSIKALWRWIQSHPEIKEYMQKHIETNEGEQINILDYCNQINENITSTFNINKCESLEELSIDRICALTEDAVQFIKPGISSTIDSLLKQRIEGRRKIEGIAGVLSTYIASLEKSKKAGNKSSYVRIHITAKNPPVLLTTARRAKLLQSKLDCVKNTKGSIAVSYKDLQGVITTSDIDICSLEYKSAGSNKKDIEITSKEISECIASSYAASDQLAKEILVYYSNYIKSFSCNYNFSLGVLSKWVTLLDVAYCKAKIAHKYNYCKPILDTHASKSYFSANDIRHPLIEHLQQRELYVTNDVALGSDDNSYDGLLLYGTNAVGKTSLIRAIGISIIMAQSGLYVPCSVFSYSPYHSIYTRILGNDDLFKGLSTFAVEMSELRTILTGANENSIILGDELCSGTESDSALSIFTAGLEELHSRKSTFLFATHFHEIQTYDEIALLERMCSKHMTVLYDKSDNKLIYDRKLRDGPGDAMYGLEVCKSLSLEESFLKRAHEIRTKYNSEPKLLNSCTSQYNSNKIRGMCEICRCKQGTEVHHLQHQQNANKSNSYINSFHKNHLANIINICFECHKKIHKSESQHRVVKTSNGYEIHSI